jgi:hypothetical protein
MVEHALTVAGIGNHSLLPTSPNSGSVTGKRLAVLIPSPRLDWQFADLLPF